MSGHWSEWQPEQIITYEAISRRDATIAAGFGSRSARSVYGGTAGAIAENTRRLALMRTMLRTGDFYTTPEPGTFTGGVWGGGVVMDNSSQSSAYQRIDTDYAPINDWVETFLSVNVPIVRITAADHTGDLPAPLFPPGGLNPATGTSYEYESGAQTFLGWADWTMDVRPADWGLRDAHTTADVSGLTEDWLVRTGDDIPYFSARVMPTSTYDLDAFIASTNVQNGAIPDSFWPLPGIGHEAAKIRPQRMPANRDELTEDYTYATHAYESVTLDLSPLTGSEFLLMLQGSEMYRDEDPLPLLVPSTDQLHGTFLELQERGLAQHDTVWGNSQVHADGMLNLLPKPQVRYRRPRWRYWIPDVVTPAPYWNPGTDPATALRAGDKTNRVDFW